MGAPSGSTRLQLTLVLLTAVAAHLSVQAEPSGAWNGFQNGVIAGRVVASDESAVADATVTLRPVVESQQVQPEYRVRADEEGRFVFGRLPAREYRIAASAPGFLPHVNSGAIDLATRSAMVVNVELYRLGVIGGRVVDENGEVGLGIRISAIALESFDGPASQRVVQSSRSDDRGVYRLTGLRPGSYVVEALEDDWQTESMMLSDCAATVRPPRARSASEERGGDRGPAPTAGRTTLRRQLFPGAYATTEAEKIQIVPGTVQTNIDFHLERVPAFQISGTVLNANASVSFATVRLFQADGPSWNYLRTTVSNAAGCFSFSGASDGEYLLAAEAVSKSLDDATAPLFSRSAVTVRQRDVRDARIDLSSVPELTGTVEIDSRRDHVGLQVVLIPGSGSVPAVGGWSRIFQVRDRSFGGHITPGGYWVSIDGLPDDVAVDDVLLDGKKQPDGFLDIGLNPTSQLVVQTRPGGMLSLSIEEGAQHSSGPLALIIFPRSLLADWNVQRAMNPTTVRAFSVRLGSVVQVANLTPDEYVVAALEAKRATELRDERWFASISKASTLVTVEPAQSKEVRLSVARQ